MTTGALTISFVCSVGGFVVVGQLSLDSVMVSLTYLNLATADNEKRCELLMKQYIGFKRSVRLLQRKGGVGNFFVKVTSLTSMFLVTLVSSVVLSQ